MARDRRPRDDDEDDDDRPRRKRRPAEDDEDEPRPKKKARVVDEDDDEDEEAPRRKRRVVDDDERPRRKKKFKKKPAGMSKGLLFGLIGGGVALVGGVVLLIVLLSGGGSPKSVMEKVIRAVKAGDYGTLYDNMSAKAQQRFASVPKLPGMNAITATDPRERFIEAMKAVEKFGGNPFDKQTEAVILGETITGDTATVRVRNPNGREENVPFIKENGRWKLHGL